MYRVLLNVGRALLNVYRVLLERTQGSFGGGSPHRVALGAWVTVHTVHCAYSAIALYAHSPTIQPTMTMPQLLQGGEDPQDALSP